MIQQLDSQQNLYIVHTQIPQIITVKNKGPDSQLVEIRVASLKLMNVDIDFKSAMLTYTSCESDHQVVVKGCNHTWKNTSVLFNALLKKIKPFPLSNNTIHNQSM